MHYFADTPTAVLLTMEIAAITVVLFLLEQAQSLFRVWRWKRMAKAAPLATLALPRGHGGCRHLRDAGHPRAGRAAAPRLLRAHPRRRAHRHGPELRPPAL